MSLESHLQILKLKKQNQVYRVLTKYLGQIDQISAANTFAHRDQQSPSISSSEHNPETALNFELKALVRNLELTLIECKHKHQYEDRELADFRTKSRHENTSQKRRIRALEAVRSEVTSWIEGSLSICDRGDSTEQPGPEQTNNESIVDVELETQYENYCKARSRLANSTASLSRPLPYATPIKLIGEDEQALTQQTQPYLTYALEHNEAIIKENATIERFEALLNDLVFGTKQNTLKSLNNLGNESHLLHSYPLVGHKIHNRSMSKPEMKTPVDQEDRIETLLRAWKFATSAATISTSESIKKQIKEGQQANDLVNQILEDVMLQDKNWQYVADN